MTQSSSTRTFLEVVYVRSIPNKRVARLVALLLLTTTSLRVKKFLAMVDNSRNSSFTEPEGEIFNSDSFTSEQFGSKLGPTNRLENESIIN
jgi:hypothetical protein